MPPAPKPEPTELIYAPAQSWAPALVAAGITLIMVGMFKGWFFWLLGAFVLFLGARSWWSLADDEISRMRREQVTDTAVLPAEPVRTGTR